MKIDAQILKRFIKKASLNSRMMTMNLDFREDGLHSKVMETANVCLTETFIPANVFIEYEALGEMFVKNTLNFRKYIDTFGSEITIEKVEEFAIKITDASREGFIIMGGESAFDNKYDEPMPTIELSTSFTITKQALDRTYKDLGLIQESSVLIERNREDVKFIVGNQTESDNFKNIFPAEVSDNTASVRINDSFKSLFESLDGECVFYMEDDKPLCVEENVDGINFKCLIAPMTV